MAAEQSQNQNGKRQKLLSENRTRTRKTLIRKIRAEKEGTEKQNRRKAGRSTNRRFAAAVTAVLLLMTAVCSGCGSGAAGESSNAEMASGVSPDTAFGESGSGSAASDPEAAESESSAGSENAEASSDESGGNISGDTENVITIWAPPEAADAVEEEANRILEENPDQYPDLSGFSVDVRSVGMTETADTLLRQTDGLPDLFFFENRDLSRLYQVGILSPLPDEEAEQIRQVDAAKAVEAASPETASSEADEVPAAYPYGIANAAILYFDRNVVTNPKSFEDIVADCEAGGKKFYLELGSGWYQACFFLGAGCTLGYETDESGAFMKSDVNTALDAGVLALRKMLEAAKSLSFEGSSSSGEAENIGAFIGNVSDESLLREKIGDGFSCTALPEFKGADGSSVQMAGFASVVLLGVRQQEGARLSALHTLAAALSDEEAQMAVTEEAEWAPVLSEAAGLEEVRARKGTAALSDQLRYDTLQGRFPDAYWDLATSLGDRIQGGALSADSGDSALLSVLQNFDNECASLADGRRN